MTEERRLLTTVVVDTYESHEELSLVREQVEAIARLLAQAGYELAPSGLTDTGHSAIQVWSKSWTPSQARQLIVYWTGHGELDHGDFYLIASDTPSGRPLQLTAFSGEWLGVLLGTMDADEVLVIVDACSSGGGYNQIQEGFRTEANASPRAAGRPALAVITSAGPGENAQEKAFGPALRRILEQGPPPGFWGPQQREIEVTELTQALRHLLAGQPIQQTPQLVTDGISRHPGGAIRLLNPAYRPVELNIDGERLLQMPRIPIDEHFLAKYRGIDTSELHIDVNWYFTGRTQALAEMRHWFTGRPRHRGVFVVTGPPGSGKSALLGRMVVLGAQASAESAWPSGGEVPIDAALHAKNKTVLDCVQDLAHALQIPPPASGWESPEQLLDVIRARGDRRRKQLHVVLDALDEASPAHAVPIARDLLRPLAESGAALVLVGTRPDLAGRPYRDSDTRQSPGPLLRTLKPARLLRVDDFDAHDDVLAYASLRLSKLPGSPYADDQWDVTRRALAETIAAMAQGNFLLARLATRALVRKGQVLHPENPKVDNLIKTEIRPAFAADLDRYGADSGRVHDLLAALAYAQGNGWPRRELWLTAANALSERPYTDEDIVWVLEHAGAHVTQSGEDGQTTYRLYHQEFSAYFLADLEPDEAEDKNRKLRHALMGTVPRDKAGRRLWGLANLYLLRHFVNHVPSGGNDFRELVHDPGFLVHAQPDTLAPALTRTSPRHDPLIRLYLRCLDRLRTRTVDERASVLLDTALVDEPDALPVLHSSAMPVVPWLPLAHSGRPATFHRRIVGHTAPVRSLSFGKTITDDVVIYSASDDHSVGIWDFATGDPQGRISGHTGPVTGVVFAETPDGRVLATSSFDRTARVWDPDTAEQQAVLAHPDRLWAVAVAPSGLLATACGDGKLRVWECNGSMLFERPAHRGWVLDTAFGRIDDRLLLASVGDDGRRAAVRLWNPLTGCLDSELQLPPGSGTGRTVRFLDTPSATFIAVGTDGGRLLLWDLETRKCIGDSDLGSAIQSARSAVIGGVPMLAVGTADATARMFVKSREVRPGATFQGHSRRIRAVAIGVHAGRHYLATGGDEGAIFLWDAQRGKQHGQPRQESDLATTWRTWQGPAAPLESDVGSARYKDAFDLSRGWRGLSGRNR
ncbi:AAA family ATPase [Streptomyces sp. NPDC056480]|uniref:AAA family ATPase n=1 Tax=Streptomyces sp. NPDC056480 TaxID=3345833 RepID=UPI00367DC314